MTASMSPRRGLHSIMFPPPASIIFFILHCTLSTYFRHFSGVSAFQYALMQTSSSAKVRTFCPLELRFI
ncbi:hypothetical protein Y032_0023g784 [Ancylostoma ceylanicum]|uniref:Uncharacterized protein n=1 Tax=Ancylostoma ceylanicum TaxID=53326 RepID=A0A016UWX1_9BILA|nr:hypothetical protein Y032_0023g784 [Ancylostoma ceylanicum]